MYEGAKIFLVKAWERRWRFNKNMYKKVKKSLVKASEVYADNTVLRAGIQTIPHIGGPLDTLLSGKGAKVQYERLEHFVSELSERLKSVESIPPFDEQILCDLAMDAMEKSVRTRKDEKRTLYANVVARYVIQGRKVDQAEMALSIIYELDMIHFEIIREALQSPVCDEPFSGLRVVSISERASEMDGRERRAPVVLKERLSSWPLEMLRFAASELVAKGLLHDEGVGRLGMQAMECFVATDTAHWVHELLSDPNSTYQ